MPPLGHIGDLGLALSFEMEQIGVKVKIVEPGMVNTDFSGRSLDINNDEGLVEYQGLGRQDPRRTRLDG